MALTMLLPVGLGLRAHWKQLLPHLVGCYPVCLIKGLLLNVIELTAARLYQWHHASKPLSKLRQGEDLRDILLPRSQTLYGCLGNDGIEGTTGISKDAASILRWPLLTNLLKKCHQFTSLAIFGLEDITHKHHDFTSCLFL